MTEITMPRLSDSMEEGTILKWLVDDGQSVAAGEDLVEIETDKATMTHTSDAGGVLEVVAAEGATLPVGELIARVGAAVSSTGERPAPPVAHAAPAPSSEGGAPMEPVQPASSTPPAHAAAGGNGTVVATPLARRAAAIHDVALDRLAGTGPRGRVLRADVLRAAGIAEEPPARAPEPPRPAPAVAQTPPRDPARGSVEVQEPTRLQQVIARRMTEAKTTIPHFQVETEVTMDAAVALRAQLKATARDGDVIPSFNDLVVKASAIALRGHPRANGTYRDGSFELHERVNVGVAVAADDALVVPTVFDADVKSVGAIAADVRELAEKVRTGRIAPRELEGGTFTVSNLGMYGMTAITPVINAGQAGILGVGALREVLARVDGEIVDRTLMTLRLSCDHRILYGADASRFLADIRELLEAPLRLTL